MDEYKAELKTNKKISPRLKRMFKASKSFRKVRKKTLGIFEQINIELTFCVTRMTIDYNQIRFFLSVYTVGSVLQLISYYIIIRK